MLNTNPLLAPLGNYGGPTPTFALQSGSPAIDQGGVAAGVTTDQRGYPRPVDLPSIPNAANGNGSDIGAFEVQSLGYMIFSVQPSNTVAGTAISPAVTVQIVDQFGNLTTSANNVTLALGTNPGGGTLSGTTTVAAVNGVATFGNLSIDKTGTGYTLTAASGSLTGATSNAFNVTTAAAHHLAFSQQPATTVAGVAISPAVTVQIVDQFGNLTTSTADVTLAIGTNPGGGTLSGMTTVAAVNGVATFGNLSIDKTGTGYTLTAASDSLTGATSNAFNVTTAAAHHLVFSQQPATTVAGVAISPAVTVQIVDQFGNLTASTADVTLALGTNPGGGTLSGTTTVAAVNGVATFGNLSIDKTGTGYTLTAASDSLTGATSNAFEVLATTAQGNGGSGMVTATITGGTCIGFANDPSPSFTAAPTPLPAGVTFPYGVFGFTAVCPSNGTGTLTLTLTYPKPLPAGTQYWKFGPTSDHTNAHWYALPATIAGNTITFTLTDGALGDSDLAPNGTIQDPGGPGVSSTTTIPTLSEWALLALAGLLGGLLWQARRRFD